MADTSTGKSAIFLLVGLALTGSLLLAPGYEVAKDYFGYGLRVTARITFVFFMLAYVSRPLVQVMGTGQWLVRHRRYLGLAAALSHTVHFLFIIFYFRETGEQIDLITLVLGGASFVLIWLMALTSNRASITALGPWWGRLHTTGMHWAWVIFFQSWVGGAMEVPWQWAFVAVSVAGLGLRVAASIKKRRPPSVAPA
jgi:DMSO/TMAO reductase YedYZ heme-binding membrane subunit